MQNIDYFLEYVTTIIVEKCGINKKEILPLSKISGDLGIEGDDAKALLKSIETNLKIDLQLDINRFFLRESHLLLVFCNYLGGIGDSGFVSREETLFYDLKHKINL